MNELERLNTKLVREADRLLKDFGLLKTLSKYGTPIITGSYVLKLMTWRDLDIYIQLKKFNEHNFFELGKEIMSKLKPDRMHYRNELIMKDIEFPMGFYWGIYTKILSQNTWKIDVWAMDSHKMKVYKKQFEDLKSKVNKENRIKILTIKNHYYKHPEYRKKFVSIDIYNAVIKDNVRTIEEFSIWLAKNKGIL
ncbi:MAG: hypothetical protein PHX21_05350 [bacterium]|nr:hypothetical protein [bacterium]